MNELCEIVELSHGAILAPVFSLLRVLHSPTEVARHKSVRGKSTVLRSKWDSAVLNLHITAFLITAFRYPCQDMLFFSCAVSPPF